MWSNTGQFGTANKYGVNRSNVTLFGGRFRNQSIAITQTADY